MQGAQAVIACLKEEGVDVAFGYPGGMILPLYDALYDEKDLRAVLTAHEQGAAHAADGYARATGKVGVCLATSGPGATNLVTGLATAFMDSIPVVAITGQVSTSLLGRDAFQETDIIGVTMPVTKHGFQVKQAQDLVPFLHEAFQIAKSGRPGPVLVDVPKDLFCSEVTYTPIAHAEEVVQPPDADFLIYAAEAADVIAHAKRPVIIAGGGVIYAGATRELRELAEHYGIPVATTLMGIGALSRSHPLCLGFAGMHGSKTANRAIADADLIIALGSRFGDRQTGNVSRYTKGTKFIHVDIDPAEIDKNIESAIGLAGNMCVILRLLQKAEANAGRTQAWLQKIRAARESFAENYHVETLTAPWLFHHVAQWTAGKPFAFTTDVGQHQMWAALHLRVEEPRTWLTSGGLGTMGFGLPAAVGAQMALRGQKRVIHFAGDGGMRMTGSELYTVRRENLPIISIVLNNQSLGMIRQLQKVNYRGRYIACEFPEPMDFVTYAKSFGIAGRTATTQSEFTAALQEALSETRPFLIEAKIARDFVAPMIKGSLNEFVNFP